MSRRDRNYQENKVLIVKSEGQQAPEAPAAPAEEFKPAKRQVSFDEWWSTAEYYFKLKPALRESVKKHFEARGFMASGDFDNGIKDFGIKC